MHKVLLWAEAHPVLAGAVTLGAVFILLWLFGFFGSSSSASSSGGNNLAAAYYAAEAAQTTAATQLQMASVQYTNQTAQTQIQANAAESIAATQYGAGVTINGQNATAATTINAQDNATLAAQSNDQLLATINSNDDALGAANTAAAYAAQTAQAGFAAQTQQTYANIVGQFAMENPNLNVGFGQSGSGVQFSRSGAGGPIDPATIAQMSPEARAAAGLA